MNRVHRALFPPTRLSKSSRPAIDDVGDLAALEKSVRSSSIALLPSAVTPSRTPSNTLIASSRAPIYETPMRLHIPYGQDKWPEIVDWHNKHGHKDSTAIDKMQLRKGHHHPYYHEYIVIFTRGGHIYRVDRRPDATAPFDTIMKEGCTAYDTIEEVCSDSLKELYETSDCQVELNWCSEQTLDLLFVLSICFIIHNDTSAKRYTLQHYNCYFLSWVTITIIVRTTTVCRPRLHEELGDGLWPNGLSIVQAPDRTQERDWKEEGLRRERELRARVLELEREHVLEQCQERIRVLKREGKRVGVRELGKLLERLSREQVQAWERERERVLELERGQRRQRERESALELAQMLARLPLVLIWQLAQHKKGVLPGDLVSNCSEGCREIFSDVVIKVMNEARGNICSELSNLANFPASFSVSSINNYSDAVGSSELCKVTPTQLDQHMMKVIENHAARVSRWGLGSRAEVKADILDGMWRTWRSVSEKPLLGFIGQTGRSRATYEDFTGSVCTSL